MNIGQHLEYIDNEDFNRIGDDIYDKTKYLVLCDIRNNSWDHIVQSLTTIGVEVYEKLEKDYET